MTTVDAEQRERLLETVSGWLDRAAIPYEIEPAGVAAQLPADDAPRRGRPAIDLRFGVTPAGDALFFVAVATTAITRDAWPDALRMCNDWNTAMLSPRARLCVTDWANQTEATVALEAHQVVTPDLPQSVVVATGMGLLQAALQFWSHRAAAG